MITYSTFADFNDKAEWVPGIGERDNRMQLTDARWLTLTSPPELFEGNGACLILILGCGSARKGEVEFHSPLERYLLPRVDSDDRAEGNKGLSTRGSSPGNIRE
jgi:hypothetical protein